MRPPVGHHVTRSRAPSCGGITAWAAGTMLLLLSPLTAPRSASASAADTAAGLPAATVARIDSAVTALMARERIPALAIAVVTGDRLRLQRAYGTADLENYVPATPGSLFRIASLTKTLTAVAVLQLAERGKLDLDAPIQRYVPEFPAKRDPITLRHLLGHTSGIRHYAGSEYENTRQYDSLTQTLALFKDDSLLHRPGAGITYSTYGYILLGIAVERASGMRYMDYLRRYVLEPAGMQDTRVDEQSAIIPRRVRGYGRTASGALRNAEPTNTSYVLPAGGLVSTASDLARFAIALQTGRLIGPASLRQMLAPQRLSDGRQIPIGYGVGLGNIPNARPDLVWNGGNRQGATGVLYMHPKEHYAFVILTDLEEIGNPLLSASRDITGMVLR